MYTVMRCCSHKHVKQNGCQEKDADSWREASLCYEHTNHVQGSGTRLGSRQFSLATSANHASPFVTNILGAFVFINQQVNSKHSRSVYITIWHPISSSHHIITQISNLAHDLLSLSCFGYHPQCCPGVPYTWEQVAYCNWLMSCCHQGNTPGDTGGLKKALTQKHCPLVQLGGTTIRHTGNDISCVTRS